MTTTSESKGAIYTLSEDSNVRLGLMLALIGSLLGGTVWLLNSISNMREEMGNRIGAQTLLLSEKFVSKDVFDARMQVLLDGQRFTQDQLRDLKDEVKDVRKSVAK